jgi:hypothetical protein
MTDPIGVLDRERQRREFWLARELPDPVVVQAEERTTERMTGSRWRSPKRAQLDAYFTDNPDARPPWWD